MKMASITAGDLASFKGQAFQLVGEDGRRFAAILESVEETPKATPKGASRTAFGMLFAVAEASGLGSGNYTLSTDGLGTLGPLRADRVLPPRMDKADGYLAIVFN